MADKKVTFLVTQKGAEKTANQLSKTDLSMKNIAESAGKASLALVGIGYAAKQAFDFGRQGAVLDQTRESFDRMNRSVFQIPDLLERMRAAVNNTIKDVDLMSGLLTLTAGATNELSREFAKASPQLLEIAKAAAKLNPTLGDTAFLYQSIATGIKRTSPLILDNLGIVVKIGEANEEYAKSLGKTAEQLSSVEQQQALLNAVLKSGDTIIRQVGGSTDSATDSFDRLSVQIETLIDKAKTTTGNIFSPLLEGFNALDKWLTEDTASNPILRGLGNLLLWDRAINDIGKSLSQLMISPPMVEQLKMFDNRNLNIGSNVRERVLFPQLEVPPEIEVIDDINDEILGTIGLIPRLNEAISKLELEKNFSESRSRIYEINVELKELRKQLDELDKIPIPEFLDTTTARGLELRTPRMNIPKSLTGVSVPERTPITISRQELEEEFALVKTVADSAAATIGNAFENMWAEVFDKANNLFDQFMRRVLSALTDLAARQLATSIFNLGVNLITGGGGGAVAGAIEGMPSPLAPQKGGGTIIVQIGNEPIERQVYNSLPSASNRAKRLRV